MVYGSREKNANSISSISRGKKYRFYDINIFSYEFSSSNSVLNNPKDETFPPPIDILHSLVHENPNGTRDIYTQTKNDNDPPNYLQRYRNAGPACSRG